MFIKPFILILLLSASYFLILSQTLAQEMHKATPLKASFEMRVTPIHVVVDRNQPILIHIALRNVTDQDAYIRLWFSPIPFAPPTDLHCLMLQCRDQITSKEVQYVWPPAGKTIPDAQGKEFPAKIPPGASFRNTLDLRRICVLHPGKYVLKLQYDTRFAPSWIQPDKRAWHNLTNKVTVRIQVLK